MKTILGNIFIREGVLKKGESTIGHSHIFDHVTYVPQGKILIEKLEIRPTGEFDKTIDYLTTSSIELEAGVGNYFLIEKDIHHRLTALEDSIYHCIYSLRNENGDVVESLDDLRAFN